MPTLPTKEEKYNVNYTKVKPELSIIIPCKNEIKRLPATLEELASYQKSNAGTEIVIVVEKGTDGTDKYVQEWAKAHQPAIAICNPVAKGKGYAVKIGMLAATGKIRMFMDADGAVPIKTIQEFLETIYHYPSNTILIGSRQHPKATIVFPQSKSRVISGRLFNLCMRVQGFTTSLDTQCGFKMLSAKMAESIFTHTKDTGFGFDVEMLYLATKKGGVILELPVKWSDKPGSKVTAFSGGAKAFLLTSLVCWRARIKYLVQN